mmetsp:Transcript_17609/g.17437  ORF Transcript_17609/g.17437 Transcript_17609/m.17437 type:complete len:88 (+) Transcript_17609:50-313(+)
MLLVRRLDSFRWCPKVNLGFFPAISAEFHYDWNMQVPCSVGAVMVVSRCHCSFTHRRRGKPMRWIYVATFGVAPLLYDFELNDFPPY